MALRHLGPSERGTHEPRTPGQSAKDTDFWSGAESVSSEGRNQRISRIEFLRPGRIMRSMDFRYTFSKRQPHHGQ